MSAEQDPSMTKELMIFICETRACGHQWDGPAMKIDGGESVTCSKCGLSNYEWCLSHAP